MPDGRTEPLGLIFANGNLMLLWAKPGNELTYWTRAFKRFSTPIVGSQDESNQFFRTVVLAQKAENTFVLGLFRELIPYPWPNFEIQDEEAKTTEGWLCKTT